MGSYLLNVLLQLLLLLLWPVAATTTSALNNSSSVAMPGCQEICGNTTIPYPFGIGDASCFRQGPFELTCDETQIPPLWAGRQGVLEISLQGQLRTGSSLTHDCYNSSGFVSRYNPNLDSYGFTFSDTDNRFTVLGCDTVASISDYPYGLNFSSGCSLTCTKENVVSNGSCTIGCCQTSIPKGYNNFNVGITSNNNHRDVLSFNPCGYAFLIEKDSLQFSPSYLQGYLSATSVLPVVLDWAIEWTTTGNRSCQNEPNYACGSNSYCYVSKNDLGYSCNCSSGFQGNPYLLPQGCQDINECKDPLLNNCSLHSVCNNLPGSYNCSCALGYEGDGRRNGKGCTPSKKSILIPVAIASVLGGLGLSFLLFGSMWLHKVLKKRRKNKLKQKFFQRNGGFLLQQQISSERDNIEKTKMFSEEELQKATNNYNENRILGQGGQGTVYKGMLLDGRIVAVKKSEGLHDEGRIEQFINEVVILSEINHRNVVKLFGCCLETEVPLLVYEFVSNGTVFSCIHDKSGEFSFTWDSRLRIAIEVAGALAYLHSAASIPIYHRDIKSTNILLDDRYRAKVSDFGISRSVPIDRTHITTLVQGTFGYLDPEYFQSSQFTEKSDVYSFGVVLVELLTGEKPFSSTRPQEKKSLVSYFISSMEENSFFEILDAQVVKEGKKEDLEAVVVLAYRCLNMNGKKRPTMKEVAMALEVLRASPSDHDQILFAQEIKQEDDCIITQPIGLWDTSSISTTSWTMETRATIPVDHQPLLLNISS